MATKGYILSEADLLVLRDMVARERSRQGRTTGRSYYPEDDHQAPETYIVRTPPTGIAALNLAATTGTDNTGTGTSEAETGDDFASSAPCPVYQIVNGFFLSCGFSVTVYNLLSVRLPGGSWVAATRDKYGSWVIPNPGLAFEECP